MPNAQSSAEAQATLVRELEHVHRLYAERAANPILAGALRRIGEWQSRRLRATYADFASSERYAEALAFFQSDLYGSGDFTRRDTDLARIVPMLVRVLPARVITTIAQAVELNALSHELDVALLSRLPRADGQFSVYEYCRAYRHAAHHPQRLRQIALIGEIGYALDRHVQSKLVRGALAMMRQPARLAGFGELQDFLERGFSAFRRMKGAGEFLETVREREIALHEAIIHGSNAPFPDPLGYAVQPAAARAS